MPSTADSGRRAERRRRTALAFHAGLIAGLGSFAFTVLPAEPALAAGTGANVRMHDIAFLPQSLTVTPGTTITWTNDDDMTHTVTSGVDHDDGVWASSPPVPPGGTFRLTLRKPGIYRYYCKPHVYSPAMHATIVVREVTN